MRGFAAASVIALMFSGADAGAQNLSSYGTPGLIDMPTAEVLGDGELALTSSSFGSTTRNTLTFQVLPRVYTTFRYAIIRDFDGAVGNRYDRSFDLHFQLFDERENRPALALGLRDFGGTGIYSSEYLVATKTVATGLSVTGGLGWGRLAERGGFTSPLTVSSERFRNRPGAGAGGINTTGQLDAGSWFRGDVAVFGGVEWAVNDRFSLTAEFSTDLYTRESARGLIDIATPINIGARYRFRNGLDLNAFVIGGTEVGIQFSYVLDPARRPAPGGLDSAPSPLVARETLASASWNLPAPGDDRAARDVLKERFYKDGLILQGVTLTRTSATVRIENGQWGQAAQAAGRAARVMANTLPPQVEDFTVVFQRSGVPISTVKTKRSDLETLERDYDGAWKTRARARIEDAAEVTREGQLPEAFPEFYVGLNPYSAFSLFDPDSPVRADFGAELYAEYRPTPGLTFAGRLRYPLVGNIDKVTRRSNSVIQRVRSDSGLYAIESELEINELTAEYMFRPGKDLFGRVTGGYLESMFGGLSAEVLWYPVASRLALGVEINYARQRNFDQLFGFRDYDVLTGHASAYYDLGNDFYTQVDVGRYLAGDWGTTFSVTREFNNGFRVGGYFTLTDVSFDEFGEGSFDKGIRIEIPLSWFTGQPSRKQLSQVIQPVTRDGGARLNVANRLYSVTRDYRAKELSDGWGRYYR